MKLSLIPFLALLAAAPASAGPLDDIAHIDVIPGWRTDSGTHMAGLRVTLQPGWKTYWRAPGDAGIPPHFDWAGSTNISSAAFHWPVPEVLDQNAMQTIGYRDSLVLPIELHPKEEHTAITMAGEVTLGVCEDVCVPVTLPFTAALPPQGRRDGAITAALLNQPLDGAAAGVPNATCSIAPIADGLQLTATLAPPTTGPVAAIVVEAGNPEVWVSQSDIAADNGTLTATVDMIHVTSSSFVLDRSAVRITLFGAGFAVDIQGCSAP